MSEYLPESPKPSVELIAHNRMLYVKPPIEELMMNLRFYYRFMEMETSYILAKEGVTGSMWWSKASTEQGVKDKVAISWKRPWEQIAADGFFVEAKERQKGMTGKWEDCFSITEDQQYLLTHEGLFRRAADLLDLNHYNWTYRRTDALPDFVLDPSVIAGCRPEQVNAFIQALAASGCPQRGSGVIPAPGSAGAIVSSTMSTGKTWMIVPMIRAFRHHPIVVSCYYGSVVRGLQSELSRILEPDGIQVGLVDGKHRAVGQVTVCTNAMLDYFDPEKVRVILCDEVHLISGDKTSRDLLQFTKAVKFGYSGTIKGHARQMYIEAIIGPICFELDDPEAEKMGRVKPVKIYAIKNSKGPKVTAKSQHVRERQGITENHDRNTLIGQVARDVPSDLQLIIYARTIEHIEVLTKGLPPKLNKKGEEVSPAGAPYLPPDYEVYHAQLSDKERKRIEDGVYSGEIKRLVANGAFSTGVNTTRLRVLFNVDWTTSEQVVSQRAGRNRRLDVSDGTELGIILELQDNWGQEALEEARKNAPALTADAITPQDEAGEEKEIPNDPFWGKAQARLARYRKRGWKVVKIDSASEIDYQEIYVKASTAGNESVSDPTHDTCEFCFDGEGQESGDEGVSEV